MRVLWISNIIFPEANALMGGTNSFKGGGGWLLATSEALVEQQNIQLTIVSVSDHVSDLVRLSGQRITYYIIPKCKNIGGYCVFMKRVYGDIKPDVVHIHGTELPYGFAWLKVCSSDNVVVSIQGLVSVISTYYLAGLSMKEIIQNITLRDVLRKTLFGEKKSFVQRGLLEKEVIKKVKHVIGRTSFDLAHCKAINPSIKYYHCDETLRSEFYSGHWTYANCTPHTIFISQATYPIKGLHMILKALPLIKKDYPNVKVRVAGDDIIHHHSLIGYLRKSGYSQILRHLIKTNNLEENISFTGRLDAEEMKQEYLNANVFICPSSIENSPNSLGEAQLLGVPVIASYVGGIPDMMRGDESHLYRFEEIEMLSEIIKQLFASKDGINTETMRQIARQRHNPSNNVQQLMNIYLGILN